MTDLISVLIFRLKVLERTVQTGVIPGELDSYELEQVKGRLKEVQFVLKLLGAKPRSHDNSAD